MNMVMIHSLLSLITYRHKPNPEVGLFQHTPELEIPLVIDVLARQHLHVKRPKDLGNDEPNLVPRQGHSWAGPDTDAPRVKLVPGIVLIGGVPVWMVARQPALEVEVVRIMEEPRVTREAIVAVLYLDLEFSVSNTTPLVQEMR
jgi:hypothetical protein